MTGPALTDVVASRFWAKVEKSDGCWEWVGARYVRGYGKFVVAGKDYKAHRISKLLHDGALAADLCVCHHCDNKRCVRPDHLFIGTQADNMHDMKVKDRRKGIGVGEANGRAKLTQSAVEAILTSADGHSELGRRYGVSHSTIQNIRRGRLWSEVVKHCEKQTTTTTNDDN